MSAAADRRRLLNTVLDLKGNIRVFCRCRPMSRHETETQAPDCVQVLSSSGRYEVVVADERHKKHVRHEFDAALGPATTQAQVFEQVEGASAARTACCWPVREW